MFVDSDDWVDERICEVLLTEAVKNKADCVMCSYCKDYGDHVIENHIFNNDLVWDEETTRQLFYRRLFGPVGKETARPHEVDIIVSACMQLFSIGICRDIEFIDTKKIGTEDCLYQMMVYDNCRKFVYVDKAMYHYRKTNDSSLTTKYNPYLYERWQNMYSIMEEIIDNGHYPDIYREALDNRIIFGLIGLGLNEVSANNNIMDKSERLSIIISNQRYVKAFRRLDIKYMALPWKLFFVLLKNKHIVLVVLMLQLIQRLRNK